MYASAMKFCGAMELCGIGYPTSEPADYHWPAVIRQMAAQDAAILLAITRNHKPAESGLMMEKGFAPVYQFTNPRTGIVATLWILDFSKEGCWKTELPPQIVVNAPRPPVREGEVLPTYNAQWGVPETVLQDILTYRHSPMLDPARAVVYSSGVDSASPSEDSAPF